MLIKNTKSRKLEELKPLSSRELKVYYCGPTVYNYVHIWNLRTYVFEDVVCRSLKFLGYNVKSTMNITDVDDKTIRDSIISWERLSDFTEKYTNAFLDDIKKLEIIPADNIVKITDLIPEMVRMINTLLRRKNAYISDDGSIYFDIKTYKKYWKFANLDLETLKNWVRIDTDEYEKDWVGDFVLWKGWKESDWENFWEEEFESGDKKIKLKWRPGWHIECSACCMKTMWAQIDIHMWWIDLIFPHHQNEIAQTESCTRKEFSKYWLHSGHLLVDWNKMSKSKNNFYTLRDLEEKFNNIDKNILYRAIRLSFMNSKYSTNVDFSFQKLEANINVINSIDETVKKINREIENSENFAVVSKDFSEAVQDYVAEYLFHLEEDFNMPEVIAVFHNFLTFVNTWMGEWLFSVPELSSCLDILKTFNQVLAIVNFNTKDKEEISSELLELFEKRNKAKAEKDFDSADKLRDELLGKWYKIVDTKDNSFIEKI